MASDPTFRDAPPAVCDFLVVGAGPAGLVAALTLASSGNRSVVLLDRRDPWREPVSCAEGVRIVPFRKASPLPVDPWLRGPIHRCRIATPRARFDWQTMDDGAVIDRARMHRDLAVAAAKAGALCHFRCRALDLSPLENDFRTLRYEGEVSGTIQARCVVDATGPGPGLGREPGMAHGQVDLEPAVFAILEGIPHDPEAIQLWYGSEFAPGGYAWLFPAGAGRANVGVVCARGTGLPPREGLRRFLSILAPGVEPKSVHGGAIPCGSGSGILARNMLFKAGDAASMVNALSRSGIVEAMEAGKLAATSALQALDLPDEKARKRAYDLYRRSWWRSRGRDYALSMLLKKVMGRFDDRTWTEIVEKMSRIPIDRHRWSHAVRYTAVAMFRQFARLR